MYKFAANVKNNSHMKILSAKKFGVRLKATVQATGKLGFTKATSDALNLEECPFVTFSQTEDEHKDLFLSISREPSDDAFRVLISGGYYSLSTKALFDALGLDYKNNTVIFDLHRVASYDDELSGEAYKLVMRIMPKADKNMES
jgi:hypothetical protein